jgi:beta-galactosidase
VEIPGRYSWPDCANAWTWPVEEGTEIKVQVYSRSPEVELLLNGSSLGKAATEEYVATFQVPYAYGELTAVSLDGDQEISRDHIYSAGAATALKITPDKTVLTADGHALCFALVEIVDENGAPVPYAEAEIHADITGAATLQAFGSARPITEENYTKGVGTAYQGKMLAVIRAGSDAGNATLCVQADGLASAVYTFHIQ